MSQQSNWSRLVASAMFVPLALCASVGAEGTIAGKVKFDGRMLKQKPIRVSADAFCVQAHQNDPLLEERWVFNEEEGTLVNVIVYISSDVNAETPSDPVVVDQQGCQYTPHVSTIMTGQELQIKNSDSTAHNLNLKPEKNRSFNVSQPVQGMVHKVTFDKPELAMPLKCDVHSWMGAYIAVFEHPYHTVTDETGSFEITGLPPGKYQVSVWHEFEKFKPVEETIEVEVKDGETSNIEFAYQPPQ